MNTYLFLIASFLLAAPQTSFTMARSNLNETANLIYLDFFDDFYTSLATSEISGIKRGLQLVNPHELVKCVDDEEESLSISANYVQLNSDFNGTSIFYMNPLLVCLATDQLDSLKTLLANGVPLHDLPKKIIETDEGLTLWQAVAKRKRSLTDYKKCIDLFVQYGKDINDLDCSGQAPLHIAVAEKNKKMLKALLKSNNINVDCPDASGSTPLLVAAKKKDTESMAYLIAAGSNILHRDNVGKSYLDYVAENTNTIHGFKQIERKK